MNGDTLEGDHELNVAMLNLEETILELKGEIDANDEQMQRVLASFKRRKRMYARHVRRMHEASRSRRQHHQMIVEKCSDQPAGIPAFIDQPGLEIVLARGYMGYQKKPKQKKKKVREAEWKAQQKEWEAKRALEAKRRAELPVSEQAMLQAKELMEIWDDIFVGRYNGKRLRNQWWSTRLNANVCVLEDRKTGKCSVEVRGKPDETGFKAQLYLNTWDAAQVYSVETETKAMECLKPKVTEEQFKRYFCTGMLVERSKKTGLLYIFRRCRPILVYREKKHVDGYVDYKFVASLCIHAQGYYQCSWAGTLVPTDDVIAQLLMMRADEKTLWRRATQHTRFSPQADV